MIVVVVVGVAAAVVRMRAFFLLLFWWIFGLKSLEVKKSSEVLGKRMVGEFICFRFWDVII